VNMFASNTNIMILRGLLVVALLGWTGYWLVNGHAYMGAHSIVMQQGFGSDGIQMWEVFNLKMVAAHHFLRWLAGTVLLLPLFRLVGRRQRRVVGEVAA
jgi:hypothetical protein